MWLHNCSLIWEINSQWVLQMLYTKHTLHTIRKNWNNLYSQCNLVAKIFTSDITCTIVHVTECSLCTRWLYQCKSIKIQYSSRDYVRERRPDVKLKTHWPGPTQIQKFFNTTLITTNKCVKANLLCGTFKSVHHSLLSHVLCEPSDLSITESISAEHSVLMLKIFPQCYTTQYGPVQRGLKENSISVSMHP